MIVGLVLAAGGGVRFGSDSKLLADLDGRPLLERSVAAACAVPALERVVVVLGSRSDEIKAAVAFGRAETVVCSDWESGQAASLRCGLEAVRDASAVVVTLGDAPLVTPQVISMFVGAEGRTRAVYGGRPGHPVVLGREQIAALESLDGDRGARDLLRGGREIEVGHLCSGRDVDTLRIWRQFAMKLEQTFDVAAPLDRVWAALIDVEYVAPCLPGAAVTGRNEDGSYNGTFKVKIGPTSASYSGKLAMENVDEAAHTATMQAQGTDKRGQGGAKATIFSSVSDAGNGSTRVEVVTDYHITGRLARFGRGGMIEEISNRLLTQFAQSLQASLTGDNAPAGVEAAAEQAAAESATTEATGAIGATEAAAAGAGAGAGAGAAGGSSERSGANGAGAVSGTGPDGASASETGATASETGATASETGATADETGATADSTAATPGPSETAPPAAGSPPPVAPPAAPLPPRAAVPETEPVQGISLMASVLWSQAKKNAVPLAALAVGFLLALRLLRRRG